MADRTFYKVDDGYFDGNGNPVTDKGAPLEQDDDEGDEKSAPKKSAAVEPQKGKK